MQDKEQAWEVICKTGVRDSCGGGRVPKQPHLGGEVYDPLRLVVEEALGAEGHDLREGRLEVVDGRAAYSGAPTRTRYLAPPESQV
jgi:hypothetical protein